MGDSSNAESRLSVPEEETLVFTIIIGSFVLLLIFYVAVKLFSLSRMATLLPLACFLAASSSDALYRGWIDSPFAYGDHTLLYSLTWFFLLSFFARTLAYIKASSSLPLPSETNRSCSLYLVAGLVLLGSIWGLFVSIPHTSSEPFEGLLLAWFVLGFQSRRYSFRMALSFVSVLVLLAGVLMAKSGEIHALNALCGLLHVLGWILVDVLRKDRDVLVVMYTAGMVGTVVVFAAFLIFPAPPSTTNNNRGLLDCLGAASVGAVLSFAMFVSAFEVLRSSSLVSLFAAWCLTDVMVVCLLAPWAGLPLQFTSILGLNIAGLVLSLAGFALVVKSDIFVVSHTLVSFFKFLEEEEEKEADDGFLDKT